MSKVKILDRTGKDLIEYMKRGETDQDLADYWAIEKFVLIDGENIDVERFNQLNVKSQIKIKSSLFRPDNKNVVFDEDDNLIDDDGNTYHVKDLEKDFLFKLQTTVKNGKSPTQIMIKMIPHFYEVEIEEILNRDYRLIFSLMEKMTFFLDTLTTNGDEFSIDE
jgi:uncharacterized ubiquitin-like protein YukD